MSQLTARQKELKKKYIRTDIICRAYFPTLIFGNQSFRLADGFSTIEKASFFCNMLAIALDRLIETESGNDGA